MSETLQPTHCPECGAITRRTTDDDGWTLEVCTYDECPRIVVSVISKPKPTSTENDVALDIIAALEAWDGLCGGEDVHIERVDEKPDTTNTLVVTLDNGDTYDVQIRG